jgi:serine/threonine protein kinase
MNKLDQLPPIAEADSVSVLLRDLRECLKSPPQTDRDEVYCRTRAILRRHPLLKHSLPEFLRECRTVGDYVEYMQSRFANQFEWDSIMGNSLEHLSLQLSSSASLDAYIIHDIIGSGGFGTVYLATHKVTERKMAIKFFQPAFHAGGGSAIARFVQEASMLFDLSHKNIIAVRDVVIYKERPCIVMDFFDGITLSEALRRYGRMPYDKAVRMIASLTEGVQHAHEQQIVHRDLKPSNVLLKPNELRIIDFGLGVYIESQLQSRLTRPGESPAGGHFTARELIADPTDRNPQSDIYSIGALWFNAVTNIAPAGSDLRETLANVQNIPQSHQEMILRCLAGAGQRYATCRELLVELRKELNQ